MSPTPTPTTNPQGVAPVRARFAPSPTGFLHIGGVRTALFNYLFCKGRGRYVLRIDDTDQQRNVEAALAPILHGFHWLGIEWDEGPEIGGPHAPYFQSQRTARYQAAVDALLVSGHAYRDFSTAEEMDAERKIAEANKQQFQYSRRFMAVTDEDRARFEGEGRKSVVRLKMAREGTLVIADLVRGDVEFQWAQEADHVIQRTDGSFIYHLASVVDDFDFGITHVIRAEEHLSNTPRQIFIVNALGYPLPAYAHLPYVAEPGSKKKLSKRKLEQYLKNPDFAKVHAHGTQVAKAIGLAITPETFNPVTVDFYEQVGYLPDALVNYLVLLGWSLDDKTEIFSRAQMEQHFTLERVNKGPASFDPAKLMNVQAHYMKEVPRDEKVRRVLPFLERAGLLAAPPAGQTHAPELVEKVGRVVDVLSDRIKTFGDILLQGAFFFEKDVTVDEKAFQKRVMAPGAVDKLAAYRAWLAAPTAAPTGDKANDAPASSSAAPHDAPASSPAASFDAPASLEAGTQAWLATQGWALGDIVHAVRVATTGAAGGPGLFECLCVLGRDTCLQRIDRALERARAT